MAPNTTTMPTSIGAFAGFVPHRIHCARIRARIIGNELSAAEVALKGGLIDPENTIAHLVEIGAGSLLESSL